MQQSTLFVKYIYHPDYARGYLFFLGGGGQEMQWDKTVKCHSQKNRIQALTTDFWLCVGVTSAWPLVCVFVAI